LVFEIVLCTDLPKEFEMNDYTTTDFASEGAEKRIKWLRDALSQPKISDDEKKDKPSKKLNTKQHAKTFSQVVIGIIMWSLGWAFGIFAAACFAFFLIGLILDGFNRDIFACLVGFVLFGFIAYGCVKAASKLGIKD